MMRRGASTAFLTAGNLAFTGPFSRPVWTICWTLHALRPLWLPSLVLSLAAGAGLALIAWG